MLNLGNVNLKMWYFKTTTVSGMTVTLGVIKKGTAKHINIIHGSVSQYKIQNCSLWTRFLIRVQSMRLEKKHTKSMERT